MADNNKNSKENTRSIRDIQEASAVPRRLKTDEIKATSTYRDPLKTLQNSENCVAGASHSNNCVAGPSHSNIIKTSNITFRKKKYEHPEDGELIESILNNNKQCSIKTTETEAGTPATSHHPVDLKKCAEKLEEVVRTVGPVEGSSSTSVCSDIAFTIGLQPISCFDYLSRDYALDNLKYLLRTEKNISDQRIIRQSSRICLINWIINVNGSSGNPAIVQLSSWYLDWYTTTTEVAMEKLQVTAAACYMIAAKFHGQHISKAKLVKYSNNAFTEKELSEDEMKMLRNLEYQTLGVTPHDFVPYLSWCCDGSRSGVVEAAATFLCQCGVMVNKRFYEEYPSAIAAGAVKTALLLLGHYTSSIQDLRASMIYKASSKKARNLNRICYQLREAVRVVSSAGFKYIAPLNKFSRPPHFIAKKIVKAVNSKLIVSSDARNK